MCLRTYVYIVHTCQHTLGLSTGKTANSDYGCSYKHDARELRLLKVKCLETDIITVYTSGYYSDYQDNLCTVYAHVQRHGYTGVGNGKGILPIAFFSRPLISFLSLSLCKLSPSDHLVVVVEEGKEERGVGAAIVCQLLQISQH